MGSYGEKLHWHVVLLLVHTHSSFAGVCGWNGTFFPCPNDSECVADRCVCTSGKSGNTCSDSDNPTNVAVLAFVCILPLITWTIVCCYGCSSLRKSKARRRLRQVQGNNQGGRQDVDDGIPLHDDPPCYEQAVYSNQITISGFDDNPDWTLQGEDALTPPPHYDDLKFIHDHLMDLRDGVRVEDGSSQSPQGSEIIPEVATPVDSATCSSFPASNQPSRPNIVSDGLSIINELEVEPSQLSQPSGIDEEEGIEENEEGYGVTSDDKTEEFETLNPRSIDDDNESATEVVKVDQSANTNSTSTDEDDAG